MFDHSLSCQVSRCLLFEQAAGVPTVPGSDGLITSEEQAMRVAREVCVASASRL